MKGFTLIELMVVAAVMVTVGTIAIFGYGSNNKNQSVVNAQLEFASNLNAVINGVNNGADGMNNKYIWINAAANNKQYIIYGNDGTALQSVDLGSVTVSATITDTTAETPVTSTLQQTGICVANPLLTSYQAVAPNMCWLCGSGIYFGCQYAGVATKLPKGYITVTFKNSSNYSKTVVIEGNGMQITRVTTP